MNSKEVYHNQISSQLSSILVALGLLVVVISFLPSAESTGILAWLLILNGAIQLLYVSQLDDVRHLATWLVLVAGVYLGAGLRLQTELSPDLTGLIFLLTLLVGADGLVNTYNYLASHKKGGSIWMSFGSFITVTTALMVWRNWSFHPAWRPEMMIGLSMVMTGMNRLLLALLLRKYAKNKVGFVTGDRPA